jgi:hypothetical protein
MKSEDKTPIVPPKPKQDDFIDFTKPVDYNTMREAFL